MTIVIKGDVYSGAVDTFGVTFRWVERTRVGDDCTPHGGYQKGRKPSTSGSGFATMAKAAVLGLIEEAPVEFVPARSVPMAGVLLGLALLSTTGLLEEARQVYGRLKNAWYGLRATVWTLFVMALLRIRRPEQLKGIDPAALGQVLGLPRAPEMKTVRRKLKEMARRAAFELGRRRALS